MLFFSFFKTLIGQTITVELKNNLTIQGVLHAVDQYLNLKLRDIKVIDSAKFPHMVFASSFFSSLFICNTNFLKKKDGSKKLFYKRISDSICSYS